MKMKVVLYTSILAVFALIACSKKGKWPDIIHLSQKEFNFKSAGDSTLITAKGKWWGISGVRLDTNMINVYSSTTDACNFTYIDPDIKIVSKSCDTLFIKMNTNQTLSNRTLIVGLWAGDYHDGIKIVQAK